MSILIVTSSASPAASTSTQLARDTAAKLGGEITHRDTTTGIPHIDSTWTGANFTPADERSAAQKDTLALSDELISEVQAADTLIIAAPMYNFSVPSTLRAWIDHICRAGITFQYSETGPKGLLSGKRAIIVVTTGGTPAQSEVDYVTPYLRQVLGFIGITDIEVIAADKLMADQDAAVAQARGAIDALAA